jgi:rod shape-determining protein MreC
MALEHRDESIAKARDHLSQLLFPIQYAVDLPTSLFDWSQETLASRRTLVDENRSLKSSQLILQSKLQKLDLLEAENARLHNLLQSSKRLKQRVLIAGMLAVDMDPFRQKILIDKGRADGVYVGQPIIDAHGIMGQITQVSLHSSTALLISDASHSIPVRVIRNGLRSIATGMGQADQIRLKYIPGNGDIEVGDVLVSSGLGGRFPLDIPVATVSTVTRTVGKAFATVYANPSAQLDRSHEILLVWQDDKQPFEENPLNEIQSRWPAVDSLSEQLKVVSR